VRLYHSFGRAYLVCPRLLELDVRHGEHPDKWKPCRRGQPCQHDHEHEEGLLDPEGHTTNLFMWAPGCRPPTADEHPTCALCGRRLKFSDLDDLYASEHLVEVAASAAAPVIDTEVGAVPRSNVNEGRLVG